MFANVLFRKFIIWQLHAIQSITVVDLYANGHTIKWHSGQILLLSAIVNTLQNYYYYYYCIGEKKRYLYIDADYVKFKG
jgi:hypothetical protein